MFPVAQLLPHVIHLVEVAEAAVPEVIVGGREAVQRAIASAASSVSGVAESAAIRTGVTFVADSGGDSVVAALDPARGFSGPTLSLTDTAQGLREQIRQELSRAAHPIAEFQSNHHKDRGRSGSVFEPTSPSRRDARSWFDSSLPRMR